MLRVDRWALLIVLLLASVVHALNSALLDFAGYHYDGWLFVYAGQEILEGRTPYLDFWDNKPPLIYILNAFGLLLGGGSRLGVCVLDNVLFMAAAWIGFRVLRGAFGLLPAFVASCAWTLTAAYLVEGCNGTMTYALLGLFLSWRCFVRLYSEPRAYWSGLLFGMSTGYLLLLKPTLIGTNGILAAVLLVRQMREPHGRVFLSQAACVVAGFAVMILPIFAYIWGRGALAMMVDNVWYFPTRFLVSPDPHVRLVTIVEMSRKSLGQNGILFLSTIGLCPLIWPACLQEPRSLGRSVILCAVASLALEVWIASLSGRPWPHYLSPWLPSLAVLTASATRFLCHMAEFLSTSPLPGSVPPMEPVRHVPAAHPDPRRNVAEGARGRSEPLQRTSEQREACHAVGSQDAFHSWSHRRLQGDTSLEADLGLLWSGIVQLGLRNILIGFAIGSVLGWMMYKAGNECGEYNTGDHTWACQDLVDFLKERHVRHRTLLAWGGVLRVNYLTGLPSPSRFMQQEPLFVKGYGTVAMVDELIHDVETNKPLVFDACRASSGVISSLDKEVRAIRRGPLYRGYDNWGQTPDVAAAMERFYALIEREYRVVARSRTGFWVLYEHKSMILAIRGKERSSSTIGTASCP